MVCTSNKEYFNRLKIFRNHGIKTEFREREEQGIWHYEIDEPGYNYRLTDFQSALGISQLKKMVQSVISTVLWELVVVPIVPICFM